MRLTLGRYAHVGLHDLTAAVEGMPSLVAAIPRPKRWPRRGRTGKRRKEGKKSLAQTLAYRRIVWGILGDQAGRNRKALTYPCQCKNPWENTGFPGIQASGQSRD